MNYKTYSLLLKAITEYVNAINNKGISEKDIRIFKQINDIIYILISKEYTPELYKELEQISYGLREKYNKKLSQRIYVDFFNHFYGNEEELKQEIDIGIVKKELNIKDIREKLERIKYKKSHLEFKRNRVLYIPANITKESEEIYSNVPLIMGMHKFPTGLSNKELIIIGHKVIKSELYSNNNLNNNEIEFTEPTYLHYIDDNSTEQFQPH